MVTLNLSLEEYQYILKLIKRKEEDAHWTPNTFTPNERFLLTRLVKSLEGQLTADPW